MPELVTEDGVGALPPDIDAGFEHPFRSSAMAIQATTVQAISILPIAIQAITVQAITIQAISILPIAIQAITVRAITL